MTWGDVEPKVDDRLRQRVDVDGVSIDMIREADVVVQIVEAAQNGIGGLVVTPNVDHLKQLAGRRDGPMAEAYERASLVLADGQPVVWASRLQGDPIPERVPGSSLLWTLSEAAAEHGLGVALIGGPPGAADAAAERLTRRSPDLVVSMVEAPLVSDDPDRDEVKTIAARVRASGCHIAFLGFGAPKQEQLGDHLMEFCPGIWFIGVGAAFEMAAGRVRRAPEVLQRYGMEWAFRLYQEPRRLARRYLVDDMSYLPGLVARSALRRVGLRSRTTGRPPGGAPARPVTPTPVPLAEGSGTGQWWLQVTGRPKPRTGRPHGAQSAALWANSASWESWDDGTAPAPSTVPLVDPAQGGGPGDGSTSGPPPSATASAR